ncbi:HGGxSTG domain-containing protein [Mycolicibacterium sp. A43C]
MSDPSNKAPIKKLSEEWWTQRTPEVRARRCHAHRRNGNQCQKVAMAGQQVCRFHGGAAPLAKAAARRRIEEAADRMAARILVIAENDQVPAYVALQAAQDALDRAGVSAKTAVDVSVEVKPYEEVMQGMAGVAQISRAESRANRGLPALDRADPNGIVDAEVVDMGEMGPDSPAAGRYPADRSDDPRDRPAFAEEPPTPRTGLMTVEDALAELRVHHVRRVR